MRHSEHHLHGDANAPARSRRLMEAWAEGHPLQHEFVLALSELVANAVVHAPTESSELGISIRFEEHESCMRVSVRHRGRTFIPTVRPKHSGLALVADSVDRWGIDEHGRSVEVWFEVDHRAPPEDSPPVAGIVSLPKELVQRHHVNGPTFEIECAEREPRVRMVMRGEIGIQSAPDAGARSTHLTGHASNRKVVANRDGLSG